MKFRCRCLECQQEFVEEADSKEALKQQLKLYFLCFATQHVFKDKDRGWQVEILGEVVPAG